MDNELFQFDPRWQLQRLMAEQQQRCFDSAYPPLNSIVSSKNSSLVSSDSFGVQEMLKYDPSFVEFSGDPGFAERAATFSSFNGGRAGYHEMEMGSVSDHQMLSLHEDHFLGVQDSKQCQEFTERAIFGRNRLQVFEKTPVGESGLGSSNETNTRKTKVHQKRKAGETAVFPTAKQIKVGNCEVDTNTNQKKKKIKDHNHEICAIKPEETKDQAKTDDPPKDYIHVRSRRGEATDSHSIAERARREKIGERMKLLQDLVPGCDKVTGKAVMLDEIINYVQSLQRQVEFLSMKLASVNVSTLDTRRVESHVAKNISLPPTFQTHRVHESFQSSDNVQDMQGPSLEGLLQCFPQLESLSDGDLERLVQMGLARF